MSYFSKISEEKKAEIIEDYRTNPNNTCVQLAERHGITKYKIGTIINNYLKSWKIKKKK